MDSSKDAASSLVRKMDLPKFDQGDIGSIVGPSFNLCKEHPKLNRRPSLRKNVISLARNSFKTFYEEKGEAKEPGKIFVKLIWEEREGEGMMVADIRCDSEEMIKFVMMHLDKYQDTFRKPVKKMLYDLYMHLPHHLVPLLIGRGGSGVKALRTRAVTGMDESVDMQDLNKCENSFMRIEPFTPKQDYEDFCNYVAEKKNAGFVGWQPTDGDPLVKVSVTSLASPEAFDKFIESLDTEMDSEISNMIQRDSERQERIEVDRARDLEECEKALSNY